MTKIRLTKNELKKQKDDLKRFVRYLPTLELKKKQLLQVINRIKGEIEKLNEKIYKIEKIVNEWADVFAEKIDIKEFIKLEKVEKRTDNIAGIDIPVFKQLIFKDVEYNFFNTPVWIDKGIEVCRNQIEKRIRIQILTKQIEILQAELRTTIQRIKLFEEVKIPEAKESIRKIRIFLGDQQTAEVVRGKIAKAKIERKKQIEYI